MPTKAITKPINTDLESQLRQLSELETADLREELARGLQVTAAHLLRLAAIVRVLEDRGEDLSEIQIGLLGYLRRIAYGQLIADAVVRFAEYPAIMRQVAVLALPEQTRLAAGEPIKVIVRDETGYTHRLVDPLKMSRDQIAQVFGRNGIRSEPEQINWLDSRSPRPAKAAEPARRVRADKSRGGIVVGRVFALQAEVLAALADLQGPESEAERTQTVPVKLTEDEHRRMRIRAAESGTTMTDMVRSALRTHGVI